MKSYKGKMIFLIALVMLNHILIYGYSYYLTSTVITTGLQGIKINIPHFFLYYILPVILLIITFLFSFFEYKKSNKKVRILLLVFIPLLIYFLVPIIISVIIGFQYVIDISPKIIDSLGVTNN